ncbi:MAG TPA: hypothetical protein VJG29_01830 [Candidatus Paceibacterota bacterium]
MWWILLTIGVVLTTVTICLLLPAERVHKAHRRYRIFFLRLAWMAYLCVLVVAGAIALIISGWLTATVVITTIVIVVGLYLRMQKKVARDLWK